MHPVIRKTMHLSFGIDLLSCPLRLKIVFVIFDRLENLVGLIRSCGHLLRKCNGMHFWVDANVSFTKVINKLL